MAQFVTEGPTNRSLGRRRLDIQELQARRILGAVFGCWIDVRTGILFRLAKEQFFYSATQSLFKKLKQLSQRSSVSRMGEPGVDLMARMFGELVEIWACVFLRRSMPGMVLQ